MAQKIKKTMPGSYVTIKHGLLALYLLAIHRVYTNWCKNISLTIEVIIRSISSQNTGFISFHPLRRF
jgi:hypothetical protein